MTLQVVLVPLHEPPHPANTEVASGAAVTVIICPSEPTSPTVQSEKQIILVTENIASATLPPPGPPKNIESAAGTGGLILPGVGLSSFGGAPTRSRVAGVAVLPISPGLLSVPGSRLNRVVKSQEHVVVTVLSPGARKKFPVVFVIVVVSGGLGLTMELLLEFSGRDIWKCNLGDCGSK